METHFAGSAFDKQNEETYIVNIQCIQHIHSASHEVAGSGCPHMRDRLTNVCALSLTRAGAALATPLAGTCDLCDVCDRLAVIRNAENSCCHTAVYLIRRCYRAPISRIVVYARINQRLRNTKTETETENKNINKAQKSIIGAALVE